MQHMVLSLSTRARGGLSVHSLSELQQSTASAKHGFSKAQLQQSTASAKHSFSKARLQQSTAITQQFHKTDT
jgi:predicted DNA-binding protein (UPF0251 family)